MPDEPWSHESYASEEKSRCNTITFGSNNPKSMESSSALGAPHCDMHVKGRNMLRQINDNQSKIKIEGMQYELCGPSLGSNGAATCTPTQLLNEQQNSLMRRIQIRENEKQLQVIKE